MLCSIYQRFPVKYTVKKIIEKKYQLQSHQIRYKSKKRAVTSCEFPCIPPVNRIFVENEATDYRILMDERELLSLCQLEFN